MKRQLLSISLIISVLFLTLSEVSAQPYDEPGIEIHTPVSLKQSYVPKSRGTALLSSIGATFGLAAVGGAMMMTGEQGIALSGLSLVGVGLSFGPSVGHFYAGEIGRGMLHGVIRSGLWVGGTALVIAGIFEGFHLSSSDSVDSGDGDALIGIGLGTLVAAGIFTIYGIIDGARAVRRTNARALAIAPLVTQAPNGATHYGLALAGRF